MAKKNKSTEAKSRSNTLTSTINKDGDDAPKEVFKESAKAEKSMESIPKNKKKSAKAEKEKNSATTNSIKKSEDYKLDVTKGFSVLPVLVPNPVNVNSKNPEESVHYLYFKKHLANIEGTALQKTLDETDESQTLPPGRTIFVINLPVDCKEQDLIELFSNSELSGGCRIVKVLIRTPNSLCTVPRNVSLDKKNFFKKPLTPVSKDLAPLFPSPIQLATGRPENTLLTYPNYAYVVLKEVAGVEKIFNYVLKKADKSQQSKLTENEPGFCLSSLIRFQPQATIDSNSGIERWLRQYDVQRPDPSALQNYLDEYMGEYNHHKQMLQYQESLTLDVVDEDGFVKVVKGRGSNSAGDGAAVRAMSRAATKELNTKVALERRKEELLGDDQKMHFYKLQAHESKRSRLARLRQEFEEDKKRIAEMKRRRLAKSN